MFWKFAALVSAATDVAGAIPGFDFVWVVNDVSTVNAMAAVLRIVKIDLFIFVIVLSFLNDTNLQHHPFKLPSESLKISLINQP
jgi:hypothetical protein